MSADDESFHPLGKEWENDLEAMLDDTEYDSELGMEMAQDAMRVTKGELSEAEFHERYHEQVMDEFGEDQRPTAEAFERAQNEAKGTVSSMLEKFDGDGEEGRRDVMKKMGAVGAGVGLGAWASVDDGEQPALATHAEENETAAAENEGTQWGMVVDLERCDGCLSCVHACSEENNLDQGVNWMYVLDYQDPDENLNSGRGRLVRPCQHCTDAPCEKVCPTTARHTRDKDGLVLTDYDVCIGCRYCQVACPYGVNYFQWDEPDVSTEEIADNHGVEPGEDGDHMMDDRERWVDSRAPRGVMSKCTMCPTRQDGFKGEDKVGTTACEDACPPGAIQFGDMNDSESDPQQYLSSVTRSRARAMLERESLTREDIEQAYAYQDGDIDLLEVSRLPGSWGHDDIEAVRYLDDEIELSDLQFVIDYEEYDSESEAQEAADEELRDIVAGIIEDPVEEVVGEDDLEGTVEALVGVIVDGDSEDGVDSDALTAAEDALDSVVLDSEDSIDELVARYESREITPPEVEEALAVLDGEEDAAVNPDAGITDEEVAEQVVQAYAGENDSTFKLLEDVGTNPNVVYIGNEPGPNAKQVQGPVAYEDLELTDNRKEVLDEGTVGDAGVSL